ncbi:hypothetical protein ABFA07_005690 [Porites harrisoni]
MRLTVSPKNVWDRISPFAANKKIHFVWEKEEATTFTGLLRQLQLLNAETGVTIALNMPTKDIAKHMNMFEFNAHILAKNARKTKIVIFQ